MLSCVENFKVGETVKHTGLQLLAAKRGALRLNRVLRFSAALRRQRLAAALGESDNAFRERALLAPVRVAESVPSVASVGRCVG